MKIDLDAMPKYNFTVENNRGEIMRLYNYLGTGDDIRGVFKTILIFMTFHPDTINEIIKEDAE